MTTPIPENPDPTKTLVYTAIAGLGFLLASFLGHIVITALWFMGWAFMAFAVVAFAARFVFTSNQSPP
jgi:hypothetical protein